MRFIKTVFIALQVPFLSLTAQQVSIDYSPFEKAMQGLYEFSYINESIAGISHKGKIKQLSDQYAMRIMRKADAALTLEYNQQVEEFLNFYTLAENRKSVEIMLGLADIYFPVFDRVIDDQGLPSDLKYFTVALSALNPKAVSSFGATGVWQIMYTNGKLYKLKIDSYVDERRDTEKATYAAVAYLKDLYDVYFDWELALVAYSCGPSSVNKAIRRAGGSKKFIDIYPFLPPEARNYLPAFTAIYILFNAYEDVGLVPYKIQIPPFTESVTIDQKLHLEQVAHVLNIPIDRLREMNLQYKYDIIPAVAMCYTLKLPPGSAEKFIILKDSIYAYNDSLYFAPKYTFVVEDEVPVRNNASGSGNSNTTETNNQSDYSTANNAKLLYTIKSGDNLGYISGWYDVSVADIKRWNNLRSDMIKVGQKLVIYVPKHRVSVYENIDKLSFDQKQRKAGVDTTTKSSASSSKTGSTTQRTSYTWYTVKSGDSPYTIAKKYDGVTADDIIKINNIDNPRNIKVGQRLKIPKK